MIEEQVFSDPNGLACAAPHRENVDELLGTC